MNAKEKLINKIRSNHPYGSTLSDSTITGLECFNSALELIKEYEKDEIEAITSAPEYQMTRFADWLLKHTVQPIFNKEACLIWKWKNKAVEHSSSELVDLYSNDPYLIDFNENNKSVKEDCFEQYLQGEIDYLIGCYGGGTRTETFKEILEKYKQYSR